MRIWKLLLLPAAIGIALLGWRWASTPSPAPQAPPNVLLVSIDSLRADRVHAMGNPHETSPTIHALARDGVLFRNAVSSSSWTIPAHMTLLTGMLPGEHGVIAPTRQLREDVVTLADAFRVNGYATAGFVSGPTVRGVYGFAQGFETYDDDTIVAPNRLLSQKGITSPTIAELASGWLERWHASDERKPFFLFLHWWDVHYDYEPPPPYDRMFDPDYRGTITSDGFEMNPAIHAGMPEEDLQHLLALYDGELRFTDEHIGRVIALLDRLGVLDDTLVVVTADHGDEFFEHGGKGHGHTLFEEVVHIPLVIRYPRRVPAGQVVERQVRLVDVAPTVLGLVGVTPPPGFGSRTSFPDVGGRDLTPWITDPERIGDLPDLPAILELRKGLIAVRTNEHKLIVHLKNHHPPYLFDLVADRAETKNLASDDPSSPTADVQARLMELVTGWRREIPTLPRAYKRLTLEPELERRLEALGYVKPRSKRRQRRKAAATQPAPEATAAPTPPSAPAPH